MLSPLPPHTNTTRRTTNFNPSSNQITFSSNRIAQHPLSSHRSWRHDLNLPKRHTQLGTPFPGFLLITYKPNKLRTQKPRNPFKSNSRLYPQQETFLESLLKKKSWRSWSNSQSNKPLLHTRSHVQDPLTQHPKDSRYASLLLLSENSQGNLLFWTSLPTQPSSQNKTFFPSPTSHWTHSSKLLPQSSILQIPFRSLSYCTSYPLSGISTFCI